MSSSSNAVEWKHHSIMMGNRLVYCFPSASDIKAFLTVWIAWRKIAESTQLPAPIPQDFNGEPLCVPWLIGDGGPPEIEMAEQVLKIIERDCVLEQKLKK